MRKTETFGQQTAVPLFVWWKGEHLFSKLLAISAQLDFPVRQLEKEVGREEGRTVKQSRAMPWSPSLRFIALLFHLCSSSYRCQQDWQSPLVCPACWHPFILQYQRQAIINDCKVLLVHNISRNICFSIVFQLKGYADSRLGMWNPWLQKYVLKSLGRKFVPLAKRRGKFQ